MLQGFFAEWPEKPSPENHLKILENSTYRVVAMEGNRVVAMEGNRVVGFINALSDKVFYAYIPLLEVLPEYRGMGIGKELVKRMTDLLEDHYGIDLCCDPELTPYYEKLGFFKVSGMIKRNYGAIQKLL